jgi:hypothetical protein
MHFDKETESGMAKMCRETLDLEPLKLEIGLGKIRNMHVIRSHDKCRHKSQILKIKYKLPVYEWWRCGGGVGG